MNGPGLVKVDTLRAALAVIARLRAELAERDAHIAELRAMLERACT